MARPTDTARVRRYAFAVAAVIVVALVLRLVFLGSDSFWIDEVNVLAFVRSGHLLTDLRARGGPFEPPLHYVSVWAAAGLPFGFETAARLPAAVFGTLEVAALILLARRLTDRRDVALLAGLFLAVAPFAVRYSQENRYYTTFSALHLLTWWLVVRALELRTRRAFGWWGAAAALMLLAHPFGPLAFAAQIGVVGWMARREHRSGQADAARAMVQQCFRGVVITIVMVAPWFLWGAVRWIPDLWNGKSYSLNSGKREDVILDLDLVKRVANWLLGNGGRWMLLSGLLVALALVSLFSRRGRQRRVAVAVASYLVVFFMALVPLTRLLNTYLAMRRIEFLLPGILLLAALGTIALGERLHVPWSGRKLAPNVVITTVAVIVVGLSLVAVGVYYRTEKTQYRDLASAIDGTSPDDVVVVGPVDRRWPAAVRNYLDWRGVHRDLEFMIPGGPLPKLEVPKGNMVWVTGSPPDGPGFATKSLNSTSDLQVIAGDRTAPGSIVPWYLSVSSPRSEADLDQELHHVSKLATLLPPPTSTFPWSLLSGR